MEERRSETEKNILIQWNLVDDLAQYMLPNYKHNSIMDPKFYHLLHGTGITPIFSQMVIHSIKYINIYVIYQIQLPQTLRLSHNKDSVKYVSDLYDDLEL